MPTTHAPDLLSVAYEFQIMSNNGRVFLWGDMYGKDIVFGHTDPACFEVSFDRLRHSATSKTLMISPYQEWKKTLRAETSRSSELFVKHFERVYKEYPDLPIWAVSEICSFGTLSRMYSHMINSDQARVASQYGLQYLVLESWMHALTYVRNVCAHHARLWDKTMQITPMLPDRKLWLKLRGHEKTVFATVLMINGMLAHDSIDVEDHKAWKKRLDELLDRFATDYPERLSFTGFPKDWKNPLWWQY